MFLQNLQASATSVSDTENESEEFYNEDTQENFTDTFTGDENESESDFSDL